MGNLKVQTLINLSRIKLVAHGNPLRSPLPSRRLHCRQICLPYIYFYVDEIFGYIVLKHNYICFFIIDIVVWHRNYIILMQIFVF